MHRLQGQPQESQTGDENGKAGKDAQELTQAVLGAIHLVIGFIEEKVVEWLRLEFVSCHFSFQQGQSVLDITRCDSDGKIIWPVSLNCND